MEEILKKIQEVNDYLDLLTSQGTLPNDVATAIKERLAIPDNFVGGEVVAGVPATVTITVGMTNYVASAPFAGKLQLKLANGTTVTVPTI